jgi:enterochelin esterase-like enzyme
MRKQVGVGGLEPPTSASQTRRAGRLRYTPADKSIIRNMDKRQEISKILSSIVVVILALIGLASCQTNQNPPSILFNQPTGTPSTKNTVEGQFTTAAPTPQESTRVAPTTTSTANCDQQGSDVQSGSIFSEQLGDDFPFQVYLPPCYHAMSDQRYPVVYLLHGLTFNEDQWLRLGVAEQMDRLIADGAVTPFMIVLPGETRFDPPQTSAFAETLVQELIPWVDQHFRTLPEKPFRAIGGLSRGAAWSVHIGFEHYPLFDSVGAHSLPLFEADSRRILAWLTQIPNEDLPTFFIDIGRQDPERWTAQNFSDQLNDHNVPHTWYLFNGGHSEDYWSTHLEIYLRWYARNW